MPQKQRKHFVVKHDLESLRSLPNMIWRTNMGPRDVPHRFNQVRLGDRWVAFAYTSSDRQERPLSLITGFFECEKEAEYGPVPEGLDLSIYDWKKMGNAWMIQGRVYGRQPKHPVGVPPIADLLRKSVWNNQAILPITVEDFDRLQDYAIRHEFDPAKIPLIGREPECEQELLAMVVYAHKELGIEQVIRVRKAFPDLMVKIQGNPDPVHLELEVYSSGFFGHGHDKQVRNGCFKEDGRPVAVLCWIKDNPDVKDKVHRVYELQSIIRNGKKICW